MNVQGIERGTERMISTMLADMGLIQVKLEDWTVSRFATDYLSDDRDSDDWRDVWMDTWEIHLHTQRPIRYQPAPPGLVGTVAWDETWSAGDEPAPPTCTVVADFGRFRDVEVALSVFMRMARARDADDLVRDVSSRVRRAPEAALRTLWEQRAAAAPVTASACREYRQLHVSMPADRAFFEGGAKAATAAEELCRALGGSTYWRDRLISS